MLGLESRRFHSFLRRHPEFHNIQENLQ